MHNHPGRRTFNGRGVLLLYLAFALQVISALFFVGDLWTEVLNLRSEPIPWVWQEYIQMLASIGLVVGVVVGGIVPAFKPATHSPHGPAGEDSRLPH